MDVKARKSANGHTVVVRKAHNRPPVDPNTAEVNARKGKSRVTNGRQFVLGTDGRSPWIRRAKDIAAAHTADLGGDDNVSEAQRSLVRRIAILTLQSEMLESKFAQARGDAEPRDLDLYIRASGNLRRLLQTIGLERRAKPIPSMREFLASLPHEEPQHADELADD